MKPLAARYEKAAKIFGVTGTVCALGVAFAIHWMLGCLAFTALMFLFRSAALELSKEAEQSEHPEVPPSPNPKSKI